MIPPVENPSEGPHIMSGNFRVPFSPMFLDRRHALAHIHGNLHVDSITPSMIDAGLLKELNETRRKPPIDDFQGAIGDVTPDNIRDRPLNIYILRYTGSDITLPGDDGITVREGEIIGDLFVKKTSLFSGRQLVKLSSMAKREEDPLTIYGKALGMVSLIDFVWGDIAYRQEAPVRKPVGFLTLIETRKELAGAQLSVPLLSAGLRDLHGEGVDWAFAYARVPQLLETHKKVEDAIPYLSEYVRRQRPGDGLNPDWGIRIHQRVGGIPLFLVPYGCHDPLSMDCECMVAHDIRQQVRSDFRPFKFQRAP